MGMMYVVKTGDTLSSIAARFKLKSWKDIYYSPENEAFRRKRPNPNLIYTGDQVIVPDGGPAPPIPPVPKPQPPAPSRAVSRAISKKVILPVKQFKGDKGEDIAYWSTMARITAMPDGAVAPGASAQVDERASLARVDYKLVSQSNMAGVLTSQRWEFTFTWKVGADSVAVVKDGTPEQTVTQRVGMEIFEHPGHYALRPRKPGQSGYP